MKKLVKSAPKNEKINVMVSNDIQKQKKVKSNLKENKKTKKKIQVNPKKREKIQIQYRAMQLRNKPTFREKIIHPILSSETIPGKIIKQRKVNHPKKKEIHQKVVKVEQSLVIPIKTSKVTKRIKSSILPQKIESLRPTIKPRLIDLEEINSKFLASYTNFDYLLSILEIVNNKEFYNITFSDKSKYFIIVTDSKQQHFCSFVFSHFVVLEHFVREGFDAANGIMCPWLKEETKY